MWESFRDLRHRIPNGLFTELLLKGSLQQLFLALDYLHTECKLVHTGARNSIICIRKAEFRYDINRYISLIRYFAKSLFTDIKADNILSQIEDKSILSAFTKAEMEHPSPRKVVHGVTVYASRRLDVPKFYGDSVLSDFGSAVRGDLKRNHNAGPQVYRVRIILPLLSRFL